MLQNGYKYPQNSSTSSYFNFFKSFSFYINLCHIHFDTISLDKISSTSFFINSNSSFSFNFIASSSRLNKVSSFEIKVPQKIKISVKPNGRFDTISLIKISSTSTPYSIVVISSSFNSFDPNSNVCCQSNFDTISLNKISSTSYSIVVISSSFNSFNSFNSNSNVTLSINRLKTVFTFITLRRNGNGLFTELFTKLITKTFVLVLCFTGKSFVYVYMLNRFNMAMVLPVMILPNGRILHKYHRSIIFKRRSRSRTISVVVVVMVVVVVEPSQVKKSCNMFVSIPVCQSGSQSVNRFVIVIVVVIVIELQYVCK